MEVKSENAPEITEVEERKKPGPKPGSKRPYTVPLDVIAENLPNIKLTRKQLKELRTKQGAPAPKRELTEKQKAALAKGTEAIKRWQAERRAKKAEEAANYVPLVSNAHALNKNGKKYDGPDGTYEKPAPKAPAPAPSPPSEDEDEDVSESSASEPEATETELSTTDAEAVGLKGRRRVTRQTKAAVKQLAVVNKALGPAPEAAPAAPRRAPAPKVAAPVPAPAPAKPANPYASMLAGVWRPRV